MRDADVMAVASRLTMSRARLLGLAVVDAGELAGLTLRLDAIAERVERLEQDRRVKNQGSATLCANQVAEPNSSTRKAKNG